MDGKALIILGVVLIFGFIICFTIEAIGDYYQDHTKKKSLIGILIWYGKKEAIRIEKESKQNDKKDKDS